MPRQPTRTAVDGDCQWDAFDVTSVLGIALNAKSNKYEREHVTVRMSVSNDDDRETTSGTYASKEYQKGEFAPKLEVSYTIQESRTVAKMAEQREKAALAERTASSSSSVATLDSISLDTTSSSDRSSSDVVDREDGSSDRSSSNDKTAFCFYRTQRRFRQQRHK